MFIIKVKIIIYGNNCSEENDKRFFVYLVLSFFFFLIISFFSISSFGTSSSEATLNYRFFIQAEIFLTFCVFRNRWFIRVGQSKTSIYQAGPSRTIIARSIKHCKTTTFHHSLSNISSVFELILNFFKIFNVKFDCSQIV